VEKSNCGAFVCSVLSSMSFLVYKKSEGVSEASDCVARDRAGRCEPGYAHHGIGAAFDDQQGMWTEASAGRKSMKSLGRMYREAAGKLTGTGSRIKSGRVSSG